MEIRLLIDWCNPRRGPDLVVRDLHMASEMLKQKIHDTLKAGSFSSPDYFVDVFDDGDEHIRILVISRKFDIHEYKRSEREDRVWENIVQVLSENERDLISGIVAVNPEEIKNYI